MRTVVISDIHGGYKQLTQLTQKIEYQYSRDHFVFCGDYVDRGPDSLSVLRFVMEKVKKEDAVALKGNHEKMFLDFLSSKSLDYDQNYLFDVGGEQTIESFLSSVSEKEQLFQNLDKLKKYLNENFQDEIHFIKNLPILYNDENHIYVHAGVDRYFWEETQENVALWTSNFYEYSIYVPKPVIFGHVPTNRIRSSANCSPWFSLEKDKIGIDGGCGYKDGQLNALVCENGRYDWDFVCY